MCLVRLGTPRDSGSRKPDSSESRVESVKNAFNASSLYFFQVRQNNVQNQGDIYPFFFKIQTAEETSILYWTRGIRTKIKE